ncbi:ROK family protein [Paenibacillus sp. CAU 1782]
MKTCIIGIDLGGTNIKAALYDLSFHCLVERMIDTQTDRGPEHVLNRIAALAEEMLAELGFSQSQVACMGMGIPGLLDPVKGYSVFSPNFPGWSSIPVVDIMRQTFTFPIYIDNDVRVNLYGEWRFGAGAGCRNLVLLTLGTGLGSGIVMDGRVLYGATSSAGEIGHMNMYREGRPCRCGSSGCLSRYVSATGMVNTFKEQLAAGRTSLVAEWVNGQTEAITARLISEAYDQGDALASEVLRETGTLLGFGLSNVINLFNPELIIIGGGMSAAGERLLQPTREAVAAHALEMPRETCRIVTAHLGGKAGMLGAAVYAHERSLGNWGHKENTL